MRRSLKAVDGTLIQTEASKPDGVQLSAQVDRGVVPYVISTELVDCTYLTFTFPLVVNEVWIPARRCTEPS